MFIARFRKSDYLVQEIRTHTKNVSEMCYDFGKYMGIGNIAFLSGYLHDMGKYSDQFQQYINEMLNHVKDGSEKDWIKTISKPDHGKYGAIYVYRNFHHLGGFYKILSEILIMLISYHHGGLEDYIDEDGSKVVDRITLESEKEEHIYDIITDRFLSENNKIILNMILNKAVDEMQKIIEKLKFSNLDKYFFLNFIIKHLYSILVDADRLDAKKFDEGIELRQNNEYQNIWNNFSFNMEKHVTLLQKKIPCTDFENLINNERMRISNECLLKSSIESGTYILNVPTGGGKTLSSLRFAVNHALQKKKDRIIYVLPFTTIIEQNAEEARQALNDTEFILEHHSNVITDTTEENNCYERRSDYIENWDCPVIFTTMVQFLESIFSKGTKKIRRFHNLSNSVLIFDEIQALPIKCTSLFNETINYLNRICNCTVVLCSATLPKLYDVKKPIFIDGNIIKVNIETFNVFKRVVFKDLRKQPGYNNEELINLILNVFKEFDSLLVILNTTNAVKELYNDLKTNKLDSSIYHLSTKLCPSHRKDFIKKIKDELNSQKPVICISTQLIEAGVDISFKAVIRSTAGLDSIIQAAGRCNRHGEMKTGHCYIVNVENEKIDNLYEIKIGKTHSEAVIEELKRNKELNDIDLATDLIIDKYYDKFYNDEYIKQNMDFPINNVSIYNLLYCDIDRLRRYRNNILKPFPFSLSFKFKEASDYFYVIKENTTPVIVPYGNGKRIIADLCSDKAYFSFGKLLKEAQQFSVNIYNEEKRKLADAGGLVFHEETGVYILVEGFYDRHTGIIIEKKLDYLDC